MLVEDEHSSSTPGAGTNSGAAFRFTDGNQGDGQRNSNHATSLGDTAYFDGTDSNM